jgi:crotonobetainyl-CoA:carnitine CoA-transferase CaiB-like acyl-CoA transferase
MPAPLPHVSSLEGRVTHVGPALGADTEAVLAELGLSTSTTGRLE